MRATFVLTLLLPVLALIAVRYSSHTEAPVSPQVDMASIPARRIQPLSRPLPEHKIDELVKAASKRFGVAPAFVKSIIRAESSFRPDVVSSKGAIGLMQLTPDTAQDMGVDPRVPEQNVAGGTRYFGWLLSRYKKERGAIQKAIAAYNAGPGNVDRYKGVPPFRETKDYVERVLGFYKEYGGVLPSAKKKLLVRGRRAVRARMAG